MENECIYKELVKATTYNFILQALDGVDFTDLTDVNKLARTIALHLFTLHSNAKDLDPDDFKQLKIEAYSYSNMIHREILDFIEYMEGNKNA